MITLAELLLISHNRITSEEKKKIGKNSDNRFKMLPKRPTTYNFSCFVANRLILFLMCVCVCMRLSECICSSSSPIWRRPVDLSNVNFQLISQSHLFFGSKRKQHVVRVYVCMARVSENSQGDIFVCNELLRITACLR